MASYRWRINTWRFFFSLIVRQFETGNNRRKVGITIHWVKVESNEAALVGLLSLLRVQIAWEKLLQSMVRIWVYSNLAVLSRKSMGFPPMAHTSWKYLKILFESDVGILRYDFVSSFSGSRFRIGAMGFGIDTWAGFPKGRVISFINSCTPMITGNSWEENPFKWFVEVNVERLTKPRVFDLI